MKNWPSQGGSEVAPLENNHSRLSVNPVINSLEKLNFESYEDVLNWIYDIDKITKKQVLNKEEREKIISKFQENGFLVWVTNIWSFKWGDGDKEKYIIWQALLWINQIGSIYQSVIFSIWEKNDRKI